MSEHLRDKREQEKKTVSMMIRIYCRNNHRTKYDLCPQCQELVYYACKKTDLCPMMENKTFCSNCRIHCYSPEMRNRIREVMRYSGPRMIFHQPVTAVRHLFISITEKNKLNRKTP